MARQSKGLITLLALAGTLLFTTVAAGKARQVDDTHWTGVERIIAIGDLHGDYDQYMMVMTAAGLVDRKGKWAGGDTHLVQTGDIPDRGPDTIRIIDHLQKLKKEARRKGGQVHTLIGNHDAMNVYGDLRYVHAGEYQAFVGKNSERYQTLQWEHYVATMEARDPEFFADKDMEKFRADWTKDYPLGWVEHRQAWGVEGEYGSLVMENPVVLKVNDTLFLHGGLSAKYCASTLQELTSMVHDGIANYNYQDPGIVEDELGPLWYRGLANDNETELDAMVTAILERYEASHIVVGHTPTQGVVWPRFDSRVILNDTGIASHYGGHNGFLEITSAGLVAHYGTDTVPIPGANDGRVGYLKQVVALNPSNAHLQSMLQRMLMAGDPEPPEAVAEPKPIEEMTEEERKAAAEAAQRAAWLNPDICR